MINKSLSLTIFSVFNLLSCSTENPDGIHYVTLIPHNSSLQGMAIEKTGPDSLIFYIGFDDDTAGTIKTYLFNQLTLTEINSFPLPFSLKHPNDIKISGDNLILTGWNNSKFSHVGWINKYTGEILKIECDTLDTGWNLQFTFIHDDEVHYGLTSGTQIIITRHSRGDKLQQVTHLQPSISPSEYSHIQGSDIIGDRFLAVLYSFPTRIDIHDISQNYQLVKSLKGDPHGEAEGLAAVKGGFLHRLYYGMTLPNRIHYQTVELPGEDDRDASLTNPRY